MSRNMLFVMMLATGVVLANDEPEPKPVPPAAAAPAPAPAPASKPGSAPESAPASAPAPETATEPAAKTATAAEAGAATEPAAEAAPAAGSDAQDPKSLSGMSILGNQEAPKSLVIVPWKSSELGDSLGIATMLDDSKQPIDKEVFMRALRYYEIRSGHK